TNASPAINTVAGGSVIIGSGVKLNDTAVLSGGYSPTGTVTCTLDNPSQLQAHTNVVTVIRLGRYNTSVVTSPGGHLPIVTGTYLWTASFSADSNNTAPPAFPTRRSSDLTNASPAINTVAGGSVIIGSGVKLNDTAVLSGGYSPTGTVT